MEDNYKNAKLRWAFKSPVFKNHFARKAQIYTKSFLYIADSILSKSNSQGVGWGHNRENHLKFTWNLFNMCKIRIKIIFPSCQEGPQKGNPC
jgi:hypothetical protein